MDKLDLTSSRVLKGSMKFTPKIGGKKDKSKKAKKVAKSVNSDSQKKIIKKNVTKKPINEDPINNNIITIDIDTDIIASKIIEQESISKPNEVVNDKSITVNTISNKNTIVSPSKSNKSIKESSIKAKSPQNKNALKTINETQTITSISKSVENKKTRNAIIENKKDVLAKSKITEIKNKKETNKSLIEIEDDTISEISDDFLRSSTIELNDSIEDSATEIESPKKTSKNDNSKENEETLIEEAENYDNSNKELSSELADETLIIEDSQRILETDEEEIKKFSKKNSETANQSKNNDDNIEVIIDEIKNKKNNNKTKNQNIKKVFTDLMNKNKESEKQDKSVENENTNNESIYELLEQEEFNQSIDTEVYNKPINHEDEEIQQIVKEKITPKRKVGRPPKKPRGRKPAKKQVELIVISDAENSDDDDETLSLAQKKTLIKKELEKGAPAKIKQENEESQIISVNSLKRSNFAIEIEEQERPIRQIKRSRTTKKVNNNNNNNNNEGINENDIVEQGTSQEIVGEEENVNNVEKEKKAKNSKSAKAKTSKSQKVTKASKTTKTSKTTTETETEIEQTESGETGQKKKANRKRKAPSPTKKTSKKKKVNSEDGNHGNSDGNDSDNISISSRTIADIIDNYRGTEISTTQKEIYRLAALKRKATLDRKRGRLSTPEITTQTVPEKPKDEKMEKKPKVYDPEKNKTAIQMRVVNGEIVIDQQSTLIDHIDTTDEALPMLKYDENNHITSASFKPKLKPLKWSKEETELFYKCLSIFGTNFSMLAIMFPSRNRKQLLNKYKNEEKINPGHVKYALKHKMALDPEFFEKYSGQNMMEIGREAVEEVRLIEEQRKKEDMELFNLKKKENDADIKRVIIKNEKLYDNNDVKDVKPILAN